MKVEKPSGGNGKCCLASFSQMIEKKETLLQVLKINLIADYFHLGITHEIIP
ncbi:MAG: hypothetical protein WCO77_09275 [bacterium]